MAIGLAYWARFDRQVFYGAAAIAANLIVNFALMAICAAMAWGMAYYMQIDFWRRLILATSPVVWIRLPRSRQEVYMALNEENAKPYG